jgi:lupus La protein
MSESAAEAGAAQASEAPTVVPEAKPEGTTEAAIVAEQPEKDGGAAEDVTAKAGGEADGAQADDADEKTKSSGGMLKTKARVDHKNSAANSKYDPSVLPDTDDPEKIRNQVCPNDYAAPPSLANPLSRLSSTLATPIFLMINTCGPKRAAMRTSRSP